MLAAHELLQRFPALRQSWPVQQARAWREARELRRHPRRMAAWYRDMPDMHTRLFVSNLELPEAAELCRRTFVAVTLLDQQGATVAATRRGLAANASLVMELADVLPPSLRSNLPGGQVRVDFEGQDLGSSRAYLHWYNANGITSTHEKFGLSIPAVGGYWTVPSVQHNRIYRTWLAVVNLDTLPYSSSVTLTSADERELTSAVELVPNGARFLSLDELFSEPAAFLGSEPGTLHFGNNRQPAMYYYFIANDTLGTWRAQHL